MDVVVVSGWLKLELLNV